MEYPVSQKRSDEPGSTADWRREILERFSRWLHELTDADLDALRKDDTPPDQARAPDLFSLFGELSALKQEVRLQARAAGNMTQQFEATAQALREELGDQGSRLAQTAADLKAQVPTARREAQLAAIRELLEIRESLAGCVASAGTANLPRRPWLKKAGEIVGKLRRDQEIVLNKMDDALHRLSISPLARIGERFDPRIMRAAAIITGSGETPGTVINIYRQGYRLADQILQPAEVEVEKEQ